MISYFPIVLSYEKKSTLYHINSVIIVSTTKHLLKSKLASQFIQALIKIFLVNDITYLMGCTGTCNYLIFSLTVISLYDFSSN